MAVASPEHEARDAWAHVLERAREELPETTVVMWFADVRPIGLGEDSIALAVPSLLVRERLQHHHLGLIERASEEAVGRPVKVDLAVDEALRDQYARRKSPLFPATSDAGMDTGFHSEAGGRCHRCRFNRRCRADQW
jgi:chromosomal replication initiation ATPase DnaA